MWGGGVDRDVRWIFDVSGPSRFKLASAFPGQFRRTCRLLPPHANATVWPETTSEVSKYKHVTKRCFHGRIRWVGQPQRNKQRVFPTQQEAVQWVSEVSGLPVNELYKEKPETTFNCEHLRRRVQVILDVYDQGREGPGDCDSL